MRPWNGGPASGARAIDYNVVTAIALFGAIMVAAGNVVADLAYRAVDPRTRAS